VEDFMLDVVVLLGAYTGGGTEAKKFKTQPEGFDAVLTTCQSNALFDVEEPKFRRRPKKLPSKCSNTSAQAPLSLAHPKLTSCL